jgi:hypothetical protein
MNIELYHRAISMALSNFHYGGKDDFIAAIRVAQSAIGDHPRSRWLLDCALSQFPAPEVPALLHTITEYLPLLPEKV